MEEIPISKSFDAALILASLKHSKLDNETSFLLEVLKHKFLRQTKVNPRCEVHRKLQTSQQNGISETIDVKILPRIPPVECLKGFIGRCSKPIEKQLTASDVNDHQNRLALHYKDVECVLMPLLYPEEDLESGIHVTTYDLEGNEYRMHFKIRYSRNSVLNGEWKRYYHEHGL